MNEEDGNYLSFVLKLEKHFIEILVIFFLQYVSPDWSILSLYNIKVTGLAWLINLGNITSSKYIFGSKLRSPNNGIEYIRVHGVSKYVLVLEIFMNL